MKKIVLSLAVLATVALVSCGKGAANGDSNDSCCDSNACAEQKVEGEEAAKTDVEAPANEGEEVKEEGKEVAATEATAETPAETPATQG